MNFLKICAIFVISFISSGLCVKIYNQNYKRSVYFTGSIIREEHLIEVIVEDSSPLRSKMVAPELSNEINNNWAPNYVFLVSKSTKDQIASWEANLIIDVKDNSVTKLPMSEITEEMTHCKK